MSGRQDQEGRAALLGVIDLLLLALERRPDNLRRVMAEQDVTLRALQPKLDANTFAAKVCERLVKACELANPRPTRLTVVPEPQPSPTEEVLGTDAATLAPEWQQTFGDLQEKLRRNLHEDALPSHKRAFMQLRDPIERAKLAAKKQGCYREAALFQTALTLIGHASRTMIVA